MKRGQPKWLLGLALPLGLAVPTAARAQGYFSDVPPNHWAYKAVNELAALGILKGYPAPPAAPPAARPGAVPGRPARGKARPRRPPHGRALPPRRP